MSSDYHKKLGLRPLTEMDFRNSAGEAISIDRKPTDAKRFLNVAASEYTFTDDDHLFTAPPTNNFDAYTRG